MCDNPDAAHGFNKSNFSTAALINMIHNTRVHLHASIQIT